MVGVIDMKNNLAAFRESLGMSQKAFAAELGMPPNTYNNYESGNREPKSDFWITVARRWKVSIDYLMGLQDDTEPRVYAAKPQIARRYDALGEDSRQLVDLIIDFEAGRRPDAAPAPAEVPDVPATPRMKVIPLFPAAAGPGELMDGLLVDEVSVLESSPAAFAVRISGDSMEPDFHSGETVLCERVMPEPGDMAVVMVNGGVIVKKFRKDALGTLYFQSTNPDRRNLDVIVRPDSQDNVNWLGRVVEGDYGFEILA